MGNRIFRVMSVFFATAIIVGCGGGGGTLDPLPPQGIDRLGVSTGTVTGFGSIFVNGVEFETGSADFDIDDSPGSQDDLSIGDIVIVSFDPDVSSTSAQTVFSDEAVEGPIDCIEGRPNDCIAGVTGEIVVAGQTVLVDANTSFDDRIVPASLDGLVVGGVVEVSGLFDADLNIRATRIEPSTGGEAEVHGLVSALDTVAGTFMINALTVDYLSIPAIIDDSFPGGMFAAGDFVEAKGAISSGVMTATKIEPDSPGLAADDRIDISQFDGVEMEIEGFITRFASATDFDVAGFPVVTTASTDFEGGVRGDLDENVKVEVEGDSLNSAGALIADKVDIRRSNDVRITGLVDDILPPDMLVVLGIIIRVDELTRFEDQRDPKDEFFTFADVGTGDYLEIRGGINALPGADVIASLLERDDDPDPLNEVELRGFVDAGSIGQPIFKILGITIETDGGTTFIDSRNELEVLFADADAFFTALEDGDLVDVDGAETSAAVIVADEVELED